MALRANEVVRPYIDDYAGLASIYAVVAKAYTKQVYVDKAFQRKTNDLVQKHVTSSPIAAVTDFVAINAETIDLIKQKHGGDVWVANSQYDEIGVRRAVLRGTTVMVPFSHARTPRPGHSPVLVYWN